MARPVSCNRLPLLLLLALSSLLLASCQPKRRAAPAPLPARSFGMGFSWLPPQPDLATALQVAELFAPHADRALIQVSPPWANLLAGGDPVTLVTANELGLAQYYRNRGLRIVVSIDPTNGLDRSSDAPELVAAGRSLVEPAVQALLQAYAVAMATLLQPDLISVASETNLVRAIAPGPLYAAMRSAANAAAADIATAAPDVQQYVTVQVEVAWGLPGTSYVGIDQDLVDFPFVQAIGVSSFPFLGGVTDPANLPDDYYARLVAGTGLPLLQIEGGWPSIPVGAVNADPAQQARYVDRAAMWLERAGAIAWFQISFTDLDVAAWSPGVAPFANLGFVTTTFAAKPALAAWDVWFARPLQ